MKLPIDIFPMANLDDRHGFLGIVNLEKNSIDAGTNPPRSVVTLQSLASGWPRVATKRQNFPLDGFKRGRWNSFHLLSRSVCDEYAVVHFRLRRISAMACSNGMGISPEAFASSYSRTACKSSRSSRSSSYSAMPMTTAILSPFLFVRNCVGSFMVLPLEKSTPARWSQQGRTSGGAAKSQSGRIVAETNRRRKRRRL